MSEEVDEFLAHFGVKGMHWGERKAVEPATRADLKGRIDKIDAKLEKGNGDSVVSGYGLKGSAGAKQYKKAVKKNPDFSYKNLSPEQKRAYDKKSYNMAERAVVGRAAVESILILAGGNLVSNHIQTKNLPVARKVTLLILATNSAMRVSQLNSIHNAEKAETLQNQRHDLQKQLDQMKTKKK
jgi:hypothetical protein